MTPFAALVGIREHRLIGRGDLRALGEDIDQFHLRADDPIAAVGAVPMALAAGVTKVGNAIVGELSDAPPERLGNGPLKYMERDVRSTISNVLNFGKNVLTFRPVKAVGNAIKGAFDLAIVDPMLDVGSDVFGHINRNRRSVRSALGTT